MKIISNLIFAILLFVSGSDAAKGQSGGFGGPVFKISIIGNAPSLIIGGMGAGYQGNYYFGGGGFGTASNNHTFKNESTIHSFDLGYGGLLFGGTDTLFSNLNYYAQGFVGFGGGEVNKTDDFSLFILEPEIGLGFRLTNFFSVNLGTSYRYALPTSGLENYNINLSGLSMVLSLRFG